MFNNNWRLDQKNLLLRPGFTSAGVKVTSAGGCSAGSGGGGSGEGTCAGGGLEVASSDARIREIGGRTVRFVFVSPS